MVLSDNLRGALYMSVAMAGFGLNDGLMKLVFEELPLAQSIALRGLFATLILGAIAWRAGGHRVRPSRRDWRLLSIRTLGEVGATATFLTAISQMPIADATAVLQAAPLAVTMAAALFLRESVGWRRWSAIAVGFAGVIVMVRPGTDAFTFWALLPVVTVAFVTMRDLITRALGRAVPSSFASVLTSGAVTFVAAALVPVEGWRPMAPAELAMMAAAAGFIVVGYFFSIAAMRVGEVAAVSPFRYTVLLWAIIVGYLFFGDVPDAFTTIGATLVTGAGLYTLWREQVVGRGAAARYGQQRPFAPLE